MTQWKNLQQLIEGSMYTLIVGREGNQPFPILEEGVSRQHLQVTVPDRMDGVWSVKDLGSSNGTFVQQKDGTFVRMTGIRQLSWNTVIRMGPDNMYGRTFWLCQLTQTDPNDFSLQFTELNRQLNAFSAEKQRRIEKQEDERKKAVYTRVIISLSILALAFILPEIIPGMNDKAAMTFRIVGMGISGPILLLLGIRKKKDDMSKDYKTVFRCPNGKCGRPLSEYDIRRGQCPACKAHM